MFSYGHAKALFFNSQVNFFPDCGPPLTPVAPPTLIPVVNSTRAGMYTIDLTHTVPSSTLLSHYNVVFLFEIYDNTTGNYSYYWMVSFAKINDTELKKLSDKQAWKKLNKTL